MNFYIDFFGFSIIINMMTILHRAIETRQYAGT